MNFTVLGATGMIGKRIVENLQARGEDVFAPSRESLEIYTQPLGHVIYAIGLTADFRRRPFATVEAHVTKLADVLQRADFESLLYLSSTRVYQHTNSSAENTSLMVCPDDPSDLYNLSKLMGESLCLGCGHDNIRIVRLSNVVGSYDPNSDNFLSALIREAISGQIRLRSSPSSAKDYIHLDDVAELLPQIARSGRHRIYNVASGMQIRHAEWVDRLKALTGCRVEIDSNAPIASFPSIDVSRVREEFRWILRDVFSVLSEKLLVN